MKGQLTVWQHGHHLLRAVNPVGVFFIATQARPRCGNPFPSRNTLPGLWEQTHGEGKNRLRFYSPRKNKSKDSINTSNQSLLSFSAFEAVPFLLFPKAYICFSDSKNRGVSGWKYLLQYPWLWSNYRWPVEPSSAGQAGQLMNSLLQSLALIENSWRSGLCAKLFLCVMSYVEEVTFHSHFIGEHTGNLDGLSLAHK